MNEKQQQLLDLLQGGKLNSIPASGTRGRNDLADLVGQRSIPELREVYNELDRAGRRAFVWLVCIVNDFDLAQEIIAKTAVAHAFHQVMVDNSDAIEEEWKPLREAQSIQFHAKRRLEQRRKNTLAQYRKLRKQRDYWRATAWDRAQQALGLNRQIEEMEERLAAAEQRVSELEGFRRLTLEFKQAA